jgi:soluble lytic murein transglycosylase-like protein
MIRGLSYNESEPPNTGLWAMAIILALIIALTIIFWPRKAHAEEVNLDIIIQIESSWNENAINKYSQATGLGQITAIALHDFNNLNDTHYTMADLKDPQRNMRISYWMLTERIPQLLRHFKKAVTVENILIAYNAGITRVGRKRLPSQTVKYIQKYQRLARSK